MKKILNIFKIADLRFKVLFTIAILFVYRVGGQLRIPFLDNELLILKKTDFILCGDNPGSKYNKAEDLNIKIIDELQLEELINEHF